MIRVLLVVLCMLGVSRTSLAAAETDEDHRLYAFFEAVRDARVARWPEWRTSIGDKTDNDKWNDERREKGDEEQAFRKQELKRLTGEFDRASLSTEGRLSYDLFKYRTEREIELHAYRDNFYVLSQLGGRHQGIPDFLINRHRIDNVHDAEAYIARLRGVGPLIDQVIVRMRRRAAMGVLPPRFAYPTILETIDNIVAGAPFGDGGDSTLLADFRRKLARLTLDSARETALLDAARTALREVVGPAYARLRAQVQADAAQATDDAGVWKLPDGAAFYATLLRYRTTTDLTPEAIHAFGLKEVERIQGEMLSLMPELGIAGTLADLFAHIRTDPANFYPDTPAGREAYLAETRRVLDAMTARLPDYFGRVPHATLQVRAVEAYRAKGAAAAFYDAPNRRAGRPGVYYVNLHDMANVPKSTLRTLAFHEGVPGHHLQIALARELHDLPRFRRFEGYTAYGEGWALYAERLAKEMGFHDDPWSDLGRLSWELVRAARLVVDTGIHHYRWTREQAVDYMNRNVPQTDTANRAEIDRYIVWPAQATAYKVGMRKILELRERARRALGESFDLRAFHDTVLGDGSLPLVILEKIVDDWIARTKTK